jgi:glycine/D-amino acid oxidase-like deaminating enzyme
MNSVSDAEFIIIGAGAVGCGVAYALMKTGKTDVLVLERAGDVAQATTFQGAGLCGQARDNIERVKLAMHSVATFRELQEDAEVKPDWQEVGSIRIALTERRADELRTLKVVADKAGLPTALIDNTEAKRLWPLMDFSGAKAVLWVPSDGQMTPVSVARAYAHQCQKQGIRFATNTPAQEIICRDGRVVGVKTPAGTIGCQYVINAAGAHAWHVAKLVGLDLPIVPVRHEYFITVPLPELDRKLPCFRIPEMTLYGRVRDGGLLLGGWEPKALHTDPHSYPLPGQPPAVEPDWPVLNEFEAQFTKLLPATAGRKKSFIGKGWPTFTPDGRFIIGESSQVKGFVMAGGCNAHGISGSAGIGRLLTESLFERKPSEYVRSLSPDRFTETKWLWEKACRQARAVYETYYGV